MIDFKKALVACRGGLLSAKPCIWGRCNGTLGADGRCNRCGSKRP